MRVLQINTVYGTKSTGRTCVEVEKALQLAGHECYTAYGNGHSSSKYAYRIGSKIEYYFHNVMARITGLQGYFSFFATLRLIKYINKIDPDIIHLRNLHANYLNLPLIFRYLKYLNKPIILNLHDCWAYTGKCAYYSTIGCYKWKSECGKCPKLKEYPKSYLFDHTRKMRRDKEKWFTSICENLTVVGVSSWVTEEAKQSFLRKAKNITYIYNWINQDIFRPYSEIDVETRKKYRIPSDKFVILGVSSEWVKGTPRYEDFLKLSERLTNDEILVLVGSSEARFNCDRVIWIDFVSDTLDLAKLYSCANVYIHCSVEDTFGKVIAEAMACGTPAIVYGITGCAELVGTDCGYTIEPRNIDQMRNAINNIKQQDKTLFIESCINHVQDKFNYENNVRQLIKLYCEEGNR